MFHFVISSRDLQVYPKTSGYDLLKSKGMDFISSDSLRMKITNLYQLYFSRLIEHGSLNSKNDICEQLYALL